MSKPTLHIGFSTDNLLRDIQNIDGFAALIGSCNTPANNGKILTASSLKGFESLGVTSIAEPDAYRHISEFYGELGGNMPLHIALTTDTFDKFFTPGDDTTLVNRLIKAGNGKIAYLGAFGKKPGGGYPGTEFLSSDTAAAIIEADQVVEYNRTKLRFLRILIEGQIADEVASVADLREYNTGNVGVVLGGTKKDGSASVGLALGRKVKYACHIKLGKVANGPLSTKAIYIGSKSVEELDVEIYHNANFITFHTYPGKAGYYFGIDNMCTDADDRILAHGAVLDAAARIAADVYLNQLESEVDTTTRGTIKEEAAAYLESLFKQQALATLGDRVSDIAVVVDRSVNIIQTATSKITIKVRPKGYNTFIDITIGLTAGNN